MKWVKRVLLILSIVAVVTGVVWVLDWLGVINANRLLASIPVVNKFVTVDERVYSKVYSNGNNSGSETAVGLAQVLQRENGGLKLQNDNLKKQVAQLQKVQQNLTAKLAVLQQQAASQNTSANASQTASQNTSQTTALSGGQATAGGTGVQLTSAQKSKFKKLATYYAGMKPKEALNSMNLLGDDVVIGILSNMDSDQAGKILAAMDSQRAAGLVGKMAQ